MSKDHKAGGEIKLSYEVPKEAVCPFTGRAVKLVCSESTGAVRAIGEFYFTKWFDSEQELMHALHTRDGKEPGFPARTRIVVHEITETPTDDVFRDAKEKDEAAKAFIDEELSK